MKLLITLAWRNIWRNRRRTLLTISAIAFATILTISMMGLSDGTWIYNVRNSVELFSGYLQIQRQGYQENPSLNKKFPYTPQLENIIRATDGVTGYSPRIIADGLVCREERSAGSLLLGIEPARESTVSRMPGRINQGRFFSSDKYDEVVVGEKLLGKLGAQPGDSIVILAQAADGTLGNMRYRIVGTVKFGIQEFDESSVFMNLGALQDLLAMGNNVNIVALSVTSMGVIGGAKEKIKNQLGMAGLSSLDVLTWEEVMPELKQAMEFDQISGFIFLAILIIIVTFGILNTVLMSVTERFREFGITLAIGMANKRLMILVLIESFFIALIGLIAGNIIGYLLNVYFSYYPIVLTGDFEKIYAEYGFLPLIIASASLKIVFTVTLSILIISFTATIYPLFRVSRLEPLKGIRYT